MVKSYLAVKMGREILGPLEKLDKLKRTESKEISQGSLGLQRNLIKPNFCKDKGKLPVDYKIQRKEKTSLRVKSEGEKMVSAEQKQREKTSPRKGKMPSNKKWKRLAMECLGTMYGDRMETEIPIIEGGKRKLMDTEGEGTEAKRRETNYLYSEIHGGISAGAEDQPRWTP